MSWAGVRGAVVSAAVARLSYAAAARRPPGGAARWTRRNHRGEPVTLLEGPAVAIGAMAGVLSSTGLDRGSQAALLAAAAGAAAFGGYDDLAGRGDRRGFRGHLGALRDGELTTGAIKLGGIGGTGLLASALLRTRGPAAPSGVSAADFVLNAGLVAGGANLLNLFDLRPGRAIKVLLGASALLTAAPGARVVAAARPGPLRPCCRRTCGNARCWATRAPTRSAACWAPARPSSCRARHGWPCSRRSSG